MIKILIGLGIIALSFVYIMKNHDKSMMQNLLEKKSAKAKACMEQAEMQADNGIDNEENHNETETILG